MLAHDLRYALRVLRGNPGFMTAAVFTLALGIGANTALFSVIDALLLKSLAVQDPDSLALISTLNARGERSNEFSYPVFKELQTRNTTLAALIAATSGNDRMQVRVPPSADTDAAIVSMATGNYFDGLGVHAQMGRTFTADDEASGAAPVAVISHRYWRHRFGGQGSVLGRMFTIQNLAFTIVGVAPPNFFGNVVGESPDVWVPAAVQPQLWSGLNFIENASVDWLRLMGRRRPGVTDADVRADLHSIYAALEGEWKGTPKGRGLPTGVTIAATPGRLGFSELRERFNRPLEILMSVVGLVLLVACVNVASLLVARSAAHEREIAIRRAVGATGRDLARQFLAESLLLSAVGGAAGLLLSFWGTDALLPLLGDRSGLAPLAVRADLHVLGFTAFVSMASGLVFGMVPVIRYARRQDVPIVREHGGRPRLALGRALVVLQIGLSLLLVVGAGLFARTLYQLRAIDAGFDREHVLMLRIDPQAAGYQRAEVVALNQRLRTAIESISGVRSMSQSMVGLMSGRSRLCCITVPGYAPAAGERIAIRTNDVTPGYFAIMGMTLIAGRDFTDADRIDDTRAVVVNESFVRKYLSGGSAVGRTFAFGDGKPMPIVGVVRDARYDTLREPSMALVFFAARPHSPLQSIEVRAAADSRAILSAVRQAVAAVDPRLPLREVYTIEQLMDSALAQERLMARLSGFFGVLALALACIGVYGLLAHLVTRRTNEIGIRMALGAERRQVVSLVLREMALLVIPGSVLGLAAALATTRIAASLLFGITPTDPIALTLAVASIGTVALAAAMLPAWRAASITPVTALRRE